MVSSPPGRAPLCPPPAPPPNFQFLQLIDVNSGNNDNTGENPKAQVRVVHLFAFEFEISTKKICFLLKKILLRKMIKQKINDMGFSEYNRDPEFEYQKLD